MILSRGDPTSQIDFFVVIIVVVVVYHAEQLEVEERVRGFIGKI